VRYRVSGHPVATAMCFCTDCQAQSGSAFGMTLVLRREDFDVSGATGSFRRPTESGSTVECFFCPGCGTRIFHAPAAHPERVNLKPGTLDDRLGIRPQLAVWTCRKPEWVAIPEGIPTFERNPG
jgi:hypothetical protein